MKILTRRLLALGTPIMLTACATVGPPQPPSLELAKPPSDLRAVRKGDRVILTWTIPVATTDRQTVHSFGPTRICRGFETELTQCGTPVGETQPSAIRPDTPSSKQKQTASYVDTIHTNSLGENPAAQFTYAVEVLNRSGRGAGVSNTVHVPALATIPPPQLQATLTADGVVLSWTEPSRDPDTSRVHYLYRIYRRQEGTDHEDLVQELKPGTIELVDRNLEWEKTYFYRVTTVSSVGLNPYPCQNQPSEEGVTRFPHCIGMFQVEGDDSPEVKVFAHDVFPPAVPSGLQAVFSGPGQQPFIDLIWAPVTDVDLDGYNVYRHEEGGAPVKVNVEIVKTPAYRDAVVVSGKNYFYSISAVDVRGNESARSVEASEAVP